MKSRKNVNALVVGAVTLFATALQAPLVMAQDAVDAIDEVKKVRLRVTCNSAADAKYSRTVLGRLTDFTWTRGGNPLRIVDKVPVRCDNGADETASDAVAVRVPPRANGYSYRVVAVDPGGQANPATGDTIPARTVCEGSVNFNRSPGDLTDPGDPARYLAQCHLGDGDRVVFRVIPFIREVGIAAE